MELVRVARRRPRPACACARTAPDELSHYSSATSDIEYLYPIGWSELEGIANRGDFDLKQHAEYSGQKLEYVDTATRRALRPARDRARRRARPHGADAALRRLRRGRDRRRAAHRAAAAAADGADQGGGAAAGEQGRPAGEGARDLRGAARAHDAPSTTRAARSASATAARTRSARPGGSPSTTRRWRTTRSPCATATRSSRCACRWRGSRDELERPLELAAGSRLGRLRRFLEPLELGPDRASASARRSSRPAPARAVEHLGAAVGQVVLHALDAQLDRHHRVRRLELLGDHARPAVARVKARPSPITSSAARPARRAGGAASRARGPSANRTRSSPTRTAVETGIGCGPATHSTAGVPRSQCRQALHAAAATRSRAEQPARDPHAQLEGGLAVPVGIGEHLDAEAVAEREQHRGDRLGVGLEARPRPRAPWRAARRPGRARQRR